VVVVVVVVVVVRVLVVVVVVVLVVVGLLTLNPSTRRNRDRVGARIKSFGYYSSRGVVEVVLLLPNSEMGVEVFTPLTAIQML